MAGEARTSPHQASRRQVPVRWGCNTHHTPPGKDCHWCDDQNELFPRADVPPTHTRRVRN